MVIQLARLAVLLGPSNILVSAYESGSSDATVPWLELLRQVLRSLSVPNIITARGDLVRERGQDRIAFLASVRAAALSQARSGGGPSFSHAARIVYLNDVFYDATDVIRLLQYQDVADMACGMDYEPILADHPKPQQHRYMARHLQGYWGAPRSLASLLSSSRLAFKLWRKAYRRSPSLLRLLPLSFYDIWVARDIEGARFRRPAPYTRHGPSAERIRAGLPFSAYCCWNGLAVLPGGPLLSGQVVFRAHREGECAASECSLLCDDLHRLGHTRVVIDPAVRVTYRAEAAAHVYSGEAQARGSREGLGHVPWRKELVEGVVAWRQQFGLPAKVECCGLQEGRDVVNFKTDCSFG